MAEKTKKKDAMTKILGELEDLEENDRIQVIRAVAEFFGMSLSHDS